MIIHHNYKGNERGTPMAAPSNASYDYSLTEINTLLNRPHPQGRPLAGIRLHFRAATSPATSPDELVAIGVTKGSANNPPREIVAGGQDYILSDNKGTQSEAQFFTSTFEDALDAKRSLLTATSSFDPNRHACIYFSKDDINAIIDEAGNDIAKIRFHLCDFSASADGSFTFKSLIVSGRDASGGQLGTALRSDLPCPPHCGTDYPIEVDD